MRTVNYKLTDGTLTTSYAKAQEIGYTKVELIKNEEQNAETVATMRDHVAKIKERLVSGLPLAKVSYI